MKDTNCKLWIPAQGWYDVSQKKAIFTYKSITAKILTEIIKLDDRYFGVVNEEFIIDGFLVRYFSMG